MTAKQVPTLYEWVGGSDWGEVQGPEPPVGIESILFRALALTIYLPFVAGMSVGASAAAALGRPIAQLQPVAVIRLGATADWMAVAAESVWVGSTGPYAAHHNDPRTNRAVVRVELPGGPCARLAVGFGIDPGPGTTRTAPGPRFITSGARAIWIPNQGDGS